MSTGPITYAELDDYALSVIAALRSKPKKVAGLAEMGVETVLDLIHDYPRRYIDRTRRETIDALVPGDEAMVIAKVARISSRRTRGRPPRTLVTAEITDGTGYLRVSFFNQGWRERQLPAGTEAVFFGKVDVFQGRRQLANPVVDLIGGNRTGRIVPLYAQSEKHRITTWEIGSWVEAALAKCRERGLAEPLPDALRARYDFIDRTTALWGIHVPETMGEVTAARKRLVFDELLRVQLALVLRKRALERVARGIVHDTSGELVARFHDALPFPLTADQARVIAEITADLGGPHPMHRLLQGDVGAGKTVVAVSALLCAVQGGHQGALMAPTEVLAEQHFGGIRELLADLRVPGDADEGSLFEGLTTERPVRVELLTNKTTAANRRKLAAALEAGEIDLLIGTHALIEDAVSFRSLGVVVIDEQHRFGVEQRAALREKGAEGATPDVLVMTATPIPRTAAMTVYGDLDVSTIEHLPPGRTPIVTHWVRTEAAGGDDADAEAPVWDHVRAEVAAGRQAYVVCPLVEESEKLEARSAEETFDRLGGGELHDLRLGLLHGRLSSAEKEATMHQFREGRLDVLVATTVIEVGVDVPNATSMVILDADRFGLAQLHQLRGRVGRGRHDSSCWLVGSGATPDGEARLEAMVKTTNGFELAEVDLELRGEGTLMGERQKGRNDLKLASLRRDKEWVARAREAAFELVDDDPELVRHPLLRGEVSLFLGDDEADFLLKS